MQKILVIIAVSCFMFCSCVSRTNGGVSPDIINGATAVDTDISGLQQQQADSAIDAQAITDTSGQIADSIDTAIGQLSAGEIDSSEFTDIIQRIQARESVDYIEPTGGDSKPYSTGVESQESTE